MSLTGSIADLNAALATLVYRGALNYAGGDTLNITAGDGSLSADGSAALTVQSVAQQVGDLLAQVNALRDTGVLSRSQARALKKRLDLKGNARDVMRVNDFLVKVRLYRQFGILTPAQADALLVAGNLLSSGVKRR